MRKPKKPIAIARWQAYSNLYFKKGSALSMRVHADFDSFKVGDEVALAKYSHLFPEPVSPSSVLWLPFYQAVMTDLAKNASGEESEALDTYIQTRLGKKLAAYREPWTGYPGGDGNSELVKKRNYLSR